MADTTSQAYGSGSFRLPPFALILIVLLALVPPIAIALGDPFIIRVFTRILLLGMAAMGLNLVLGYGGLISLMHAAFFGVGGYVVAILAHHDFNNEAFLGLISGTSVLAISIPLGLLVVSLVAAFTGYISLRTSGVFFIMITLAFNQMIYYFFIAAQQYGGDDGLQILSDVRLFGLSGSNRIAFYYVCLALVAATLFFLSRLVESRFGMVIRAAAQNERRLAALGTPVLRYRLAAFIISGAIAGLAGALWAVSQGFVSPADMSWGRSGELVVMAVLGGLGAAWGPLVGAAAFLGLELFISEWTSYWQLPFGVVIILMVVFLKGGLVGLCQKLARRWQ